MSVLEVNDLRVAISQTQILRGVSFDLQAGQTLGVVGESGCGKSMTGHALMGMVPAPGVVTGSIRLAGRELMSLREREWQQIRGSEIAVVMQDPFSSLNPVMRVGHQIAEVYELHRGMGRTEARKAAVTMLERVGVPEPEKSARKFPHQMSGGQRQRVVIACAFACQPKVLIADEPTTALDVSLQAQILQLLKRLQEENGTAVLLISHDIGVIAEVSQRMAVFYAGRVVEQGVTGEVLTNPRHPYTRALLASVPRVGAHRLESIPGQPPAFNAMPMGCAYAPRCPLRAEQCEQDPALESDGSGHRVACWRPNG